MRSSRFAPWLLIAVIALIAYGSLYPFRFQPQAVRGGLLEAFKELTWARAGQADRLYNVLLYIPLGFCVYLWRSGPGRMVHHILLALVLGALLSLSIEIAQAYFSPRVPSLRDLVLNVFGAFVGALAGAGWMAMSRLLPVPSRSVVPQRDPAAITVVLLWVAWRLAPFIPRLDLGQLKGALQPLFNPQLQAAAIGAYLCYWLIVGRALFSFTRRHLHVEALLIVIAVVLMGRLLLGHLGFVPSELAALLLVLPGMIILDRLRRTPTHALLLAGLAMIVAGERMFPFDFVADPGSFDVLAPLHWAAEGFPVHTPALFQKLFVFAALWWLMHELGASERLTGSVLVGFVAGIEVAQLWLPARLATLSDPLLAAMVALFMGAVSSKRTRRPRV